MGANGFRFCGLAEILPRAELPEEDPEEDFFAFAMRGTLAEER